MEENKVVETEVEETKEEVVEVIDEKKEKRKKLIKRILIGLAGAGAVIGAGALLLKKDPEIEEYSQEDLKRKGLVNDDGISDEGFGYRMEPAESDRKNLWTITDIEDSKTKEETTEG